MTKDIKDNQVPNESSTHSADVHGAAGEHHKLVLQEKSHAESQKSGAGRKVGKGLILAGLGCIVALKVYLMLFVIDPIVGIYGFTTIMLVFLAFFFTFTKYKDPSKYSTDGTTSQMEPYVSVFVPTKNDGVLIRPVVEALLASSYNKLEVILINDGSTDNSGAVMDDLRRESPGRVKVIHLARNLGKRKAIREGIRSGNPSGDIFVLVDSDSIVDKYAIERLVKSFRDPDVGAVTGHGRARNADENTLTKIQDTWYDGQFYVMKGLESSFNTVTCCSGSLSAYRREAVMPCLDKWCNDTFLGAEFRPGDDRHLTSFLLGGTKHYLDAKAKAWKVLYCESAVVHTEAPSSFTKFLRQQIRWKKSWVRVFLFNAPFYIKGRSPVASIYYYVQLLLSLVSPIIAFRALIMLPTQGHFIDSIVYITGLLFIGFMYGLTFRLRNPGSGNRWVYRILMTMIAIPISILLYYSMLTVKKTSWLTR
jgi:hyaluronan synthase